MLIRRRKAVNSKHAACPRWLKIETICWSATVLWGGTHLSMRREWVEEACGENAPLALCPGEGAGEGRERGWLCLACSTLNTFAQSSGYCHKIRRLHLEWQRDLPE